MKIAVQDANVFIDMEVASLFDPWFQLGIETHTTDFIRAELEKGNHHVALRYFKTQQVKEHTSSFDELVQIAALETEVQNKAKFNDCSVLFLAMKLDAMLLSGDKALRHAAKVRHVETHGTLWMIDQLVIRGIISAEIASEKVSFLLSSNRYLPKTQCEQFIRKWLA